MLFGQVVDWEQGGRTTSAHVHRIFDKEPATGANQVHAIIHRSVFAALRSNRDTRMCSPVCHKIYSIVVAANSGSVVMVHKSTSLVSLHVAYHCMSQCQAVSDTDTGVTCSERSCKRACCMSTVMSVDYP